ncbi:MAG: hypothetical protein R8G34_15495 [Paracoccaceae bacterium]|nr:hypothetical protein [Paracoccaceae bacterium]
MGRLTPDLFITGIGAVTPVGLTAAQSLAATRANTSGFEDRIQSHPFGSTQSVASVPANWRLQRTPGEWLTNMAVRALAEVLDRDETVVLAAGPDAFRQHPAAETWPKEGFLSSLRARTDYAFHAASSEVSGGAAGIVGALEQAAALIALGDAEEVILLASDSYVNDRDIARLKAAERLSGETNAQGVIPGEGAVALRLAAVPRNPSDAVIRAVGTGQEACPVIGERQSQGRGMQQALEGTISEETPESAVDFIVANFNGERYSGLEALIFRARHYRTHRPFMVTAFPAMSVGDIGSASGLYCLAVAADSFKEGYAPGAVAMCEVSSEAGERAAAVVARGE